MRLPPLLIIILLIPAMIALGHDAYLFYQEHLNPGAFNLTLLQEEWKFSALGFIWTTYDVESYKMAVGSMAEEEWAVIDYILTFKAFYTGLAFAGFFILIFALLALFGIGPMSGKEKGVIHGSSRNSGFKKKK